jgi:hypothetical protein
VLKKLAAALFGSGRHTPEKIFAAVFLAATLILRIYTIMPEVRYPDAMLNDTVLHDATIRAASRSIARGESPLNSWLDSIAVGYPFLRQYQPLSFVVAGGIHAVLGLDPQDASKLRALIVALSLAAFPFAVYRCARDLGLDRIGATGAAAISPLLEAPLLLGLTDQSYLWRGFGLYTQAPAAILFALGIGATSRALEKGHGTVRAGLLLGANLITHFIYGWLGALSAGALALVGTAPLADRAKRLALIGAVTAASSAFVLLPAVSTAPYANQSAIEPSEKWEGYGFAKISGWTASGRMLDGDADWDGTWGWRAESRSWPVVSLLAGAGLLLAVVAIGFSFARRPLLVAPRAPALQVLVLLAIGWLLLCGRITFGGLMDLVPGAKYLHLQRAIANVHLAAMLLGGFALMAAFGLIRRFTRSLIPELARVVQLIALAVFAAVVGVFLGPAVRERIRFNEGNASMAQTAHDSLEREKSLELLLARAAEAQPGRLYPGHAIHPQLWWKIPGGVPLDGIAVSRDVPTLGHLWHPFALAGDLAYFKLDPYVAADAETFGIRSLLFPVGARAPDYAREVARDGSHVLYVRDGPALFGFASAPRTIQVSVRDGYQIATEWYASGDRKRGQMPLLALAGEKHWLPAGPADRAPRGRVIREEADDGRFLAEVVIDEPGYLVARIGYHPALGATVDGQPSEVACLVPGFAGVRLEPGPHRIRLFVAPSRIRLPLAFAGVAVIALIFVALRRSATKA